MDEMLNKHGQLAIVVVGFFATLQVLVVQSTAHAAPPVRIVLTLAVALALAARYWWVILLLPWPFQWFRLVLILSAWSMLPFVAVFTTDARRWVLALAALSAIGCITEIFNGLTGQWRIGSDAMMRSLKRDHILGAGAAASATVVLLLAASAWTSPVLEWIIVVMVIADWVRLVLMIRRHERLLTAERST